MSDQAMTGHDRIEGEWSLPMSLTEIANRLKNMSSRQAKRFLEPTGLIRLSRKRWRVRLDTLDKLTRYLIEHGRPPR
ncbi:MAG: hypothetical protein IT436_15995 [Phycisphaerales bacterium]|nr:hypothetical protein [Phycisphaerales bacterium]